MKMGEMQLRINLSLRTIYLLFTAFIFFILANEIRAVQLKVEQLSGWNYPVPPHNENMLFYVQRSNNTNAIVYETNFLDDGTINKAEPVHIFWIRYSSDSTHAELTYIQRKYAYGIEGVEIEGKNGQFILNFVSYTKKKFYLLPIREGNKYQALTSINGKMAILERVFISLSGGTFWFPKLDDIEMRGRDPLTNEVLVEHFKP